MRALFLILVVISKCSLEEYCNQIAKRHFYRKISKKSDAKNNANDEPKVNPEFFDCGVKDSCTHVVKFKDTNTYDIVHGEADLKNIKRPITVWEKQAAVNQGRETKPKSDWIVIQRRVDASVNFNRNWSDYKSGFGHRSGNFWIGLDKMHCLASPCKGTVLNITMKHHYYPNKLFYATYSMFEIGDEASGYQLKIGGYSGNAGDSLAYQNKMKFSTYDKDNDLDKGNCAVKYSGAWWYNACFLANLNNLYPGRYATDPVYMSWKEIAASFGNIIKSEMKIKTIENSNNC